VGVVNRAYLCLDVVETWRRHNTEANQKHICLRITERSQSIIIFLTRSIPQSQTHRLTINHNRGRVVVEHCWDVFAGKSVGGVGNEQTGFAHGTVASDDAFYGLCSLGGHFGRDVLLIRRFGCDIAVPNAIREVCVRWRIAAAIVCSCFTVSRAD
jgi:hypothetical protein